MSPRPGPVSAAPYVITLGTAGGPRWWEGPNAGKRAGISTAVVVGDAVYLVDCGYGAGRQLQLSEAPFGNLTAVFLTHLHSDHIVDLPGLIMFGIVNLAGSDRQIPIIGPGDRGELPPVSPHAERAPEPVAPEAPTPGTTGLFSGIVSAFATDLNDRILNALRPGPGAKFSPRDIEIPEGIGYHPNDNPYPDMEPFEIYRDEQVRVTATLVAHAPMTPAFAFRFENDHGSVVISGDTGPCENMVRIARDCDILLHEAIDFDWVHRDYDASTPFQRASIDHHHRSHTSPEDAVGIANRAGAKTLVLHHLVPGAGLDEVWERAGVNCDGRFIVPQDLDVIHPEPQATDRGTAASSHSGSGS